MLVVCVCKDQNIEIRITTKRVFGCASITKKKAAEKAGLGFKFWLFWLFSIALCFLAGKASLHARQMAMSLHAKGKMCNQRNAPAACPYRVSRLPSISESLVIA